MGRAGHAPRSPLASASSDVGVFSANWCVGQQNSTAIDSHSWAAKGRNPLGDLGTMGAVAPVAGLARLITAGAPALSQSARKLLATATDQPHHALQYLLHMQEEPIIRVRA